MSSITDCPHRGSKKSSETKYCDECGVPLEAEKPSRPEGEMTEQEFDALLQLREGKDQLLKHHPRSPIPESVRQGFKGANYFPIEPSYRFFCRLIRYPDTTTIRMMTSTGDEREYLRIGYVTFAIGDKTLTLQTYKTVHENENEGERESLFTPFRDATSGKETYGSGRYLEIEEAEDGLFLVDFNRAYNPYCTYSDKFSCPYPPKENWLDVEIRAGERKFRD